MTHVQGAVLNCSIVHHNNLLLCDPAAQVALAASKRDPGRHANPSRHHIHVHRLRQVSEMQLGGTCQLLHALCMCKMLLDMLQCVNCCRYLYITVTLDGGASSQSYFGTCSGACPGYTCCMKKRASGTSSSQAAAAVQSMQQPDVHHAARADEARDAAAMAAGTLHLSALALQC